MMAMKNNLCVIVLSAVLSLLASALRAAEPIRIAIESTAGVPQSFLVGGNNVESVIAQVVERQGELAALAGQPFTANVNYLGVPNSAILSISADGRSATLTIPSANYTQDFSASNPDQLNKDIQKFLKKDGSSQLAEMRRQVNKESPVGITDGNPNSTTAMFAENFFDALGLNPGRQFGDEAESARQTRMSWVSVGGAFNADEFHGWRVSSRLQVDHRVNRRVSLVAFMPVNYVSLEGSQVYGVGGALEPRWR